ncbi:MAG: hypothetical protein IIU52_02940, partial [Bacteroidaceae bacterium]|nr:hypothetical protein [Bacteroidaceae bacterium]
MFDGIYDQPPSDASLSLGFTPSDVPNRFTIVLDARNYDEWIYLNLHQRTMSIHPIPTELTAQWDGKSVWGKYSVYGTIPMYLNLFFFFPMVYGIISLIFHCEFSLLIYKNARD